MTGDLSSNWVSFRAEFDDYSLATGREKAADVQAADVQAAMLRRLMGNDCCHIYKHNLGLSQAQQEDVAAVLVAL